MANNISNMKNVNVISASDARKDWSRLIDDVVYNKPQFIRRTRDNVIMTDINLFSDILEAYQLSATKYVEEDNSITLSLNELDIVVNGKNEEEAIHNLASDVLEYSKEYYDEYHLWKAAPNRKKHFPYVLKVLILGDITKIGDSITWQHGKN